MRHSVAYQILLAIAIVTITLNACKKDKAKGIDKELFDMAKSTAGFTWYKNSDALLNKSAGSGHSEPYLRTRYNNVAALVLDSAGKLIPGGIFPNGSLIVKELYSNSSEIGRYAILYKKPSDENADVSGWVWGYINASGSVAKPASDEGNGCRSCHLQANNIDLNLMNIYFP